MQTKLKDIINEIDNYFIMFYEKELQIVGDITLHLKPNSDLRRLFSERAINEIEKIYGDIELIKTSDNVYTEYGLQTSEEE